MLNIQAALGKPQIIIQEVSENVHTFSVQYLPRGFGNTLGNSLRRIILGYDLGGAITGLKVKGIQHEYSTMDGVKESVIDMMLNFKKLRFDVDTGEKLIWVTQKFSGLKKVTSDDLKLPGGIELATEGIDLFEITDPSTEVEVSYRIEKGYGYYGIDFLKKREEKSGESDIGLLLIDNDFRMIDYIKYTVDEVLEDFSGSSKDKLTIEVCTLSKLVSPQKILSFAGEVLSMYAKLFVFDENYIDYSYFVNLDQIKSESNSDGQAIKTMPIDVLPLSERTRNALIKNGIEYVEDLEMKTKNELLVMKGLGKKAIDEIVKSLEDIEKSLAG